VTENKAMQEGVGVVEGGCTVHDGGEGLHDVAAFSCSMVSFEGRGFFSCVSVFFSLVLSKLVTSEMSGLSLIIADDRSVVW